jgi:uncharacterized protein (TIGR02996 family)
MSDEAALLAAILAHPDEDTPRLVYADWLDEHGQHDRAEFIRIQCDPAADEAAEDRAVELEERNRAKWLAGLPLFPGARWEFRRGFPEFLDAPGEAFLECYDAFARSPWLRFLSLYDVSNWMVRDFCNRPWNPRWVELELQDHPMAGTGTWGYESTPAARAIANCPQVQQLRRLLLSLLSLTPDAVQLLAASPYLENLKALEIGTLRDESRLEPLIERFGDRLVVG